MLRLLQGGAAAAGAAAAVVIAKGYHESGCAEEAVKRFQVISVPDDHRSLEDAREAARELVLRRKEECGAPGITIAVNKNGRPIWAEGFGYADVENMSAMSPRHVLRIASISKSVTMALVGRAVDAGQLDVSAPVQTYLPHYPRHCVDGQQVDMTTDHIVMHRSGIRHYWKKEDVEEIKKKAKDLKKNKLAHEIMSEEEAKKKDSMASSNDDTSSADKTKEKKTKESKDEKKPSGDGKKNKDKGKIAETEIKEFNITTKYSSVGEALSLFKDDELIHKPGEDYHYSTHGFTVVSAVLEAATKTKFSTLLTRMFRDMGLRDTYLDENEPIIRNRAKYYVRAAGGRLHNAPHVDNSWKWAGGGLLSTPADLCRFADTMLYSWQADAAAAAPAPYLRPATARWLWTYLPVPEAAAARFGPGEGYARGWLVRGERPDLGAGPNAAFVAWHTGGAAGCSSVVLVRPDGERAGSDGRPRGVTVAVIANLAGVGLTALAEDVARLFAD